MYVGSPRRRCLSNAIYIFPATIDGFVSHWAVVAALSKFIENCIYEYQEGLCHNLECFLGLLVECWQLQHPVPTSFYFFCHSQLILAHSTIRTYLAGIQHFMFLKDPNRPSIFSTHPIMVILKGIQNSSPPVLLSILPITGHIFRDMFDMLTRSPFKYIPSMVLKAVIYLTFYSLLRPGEFTCSGIGSRILLVN